MRDSRDRKERTMRTISRVAQKKVGRCWKETYRTENEAEVYEALANDLIAKKLNNASSIKSIRRNSNYDGTQEIIVTYDMDVRAIYTVRI